MVPTTTSSRLLLCLVLLRQPPGRPQLVPPIRRRGQRPGLRDITRAIKRDCFAQAPVDRIGGRVVGDGGASALKIGEP